MPGLSLPPFPDDIPTIPLLVIDYELIKAGDGQEIERLWDAATDLGFWYLKNHGVDEEVDGMFDMGAETMDLPLDEKLKYEQGDLGHSFGYKAAGTYATDQHGSTDTVEFINISKDDALAYPHIIHRTYPPTVTARMQKTIIPFVRKSLEVMDTLFTIFESKLSLPPGTLLKSHSPSEASGSEARTIKMLPRKLDPDSTSTSTSGSRLLLKDKENMKVAHGAHTDFGSLSFLHNRLGGLQVLPRGSSNIEEDWVYVRPIIGHAICNIGDTLTLYSGGILKSSLHRVVPPPGEQGAHERWSVVFFSRPGFGQDLRALGEESEVVRDALGRMGEEERKRYEPGATSGEWYTRRMVNLRIKNRTGPESWIASRGMEHTLEAR